MALVPTASRTVTIQPQSFGCGCSLTYSWTPKHPLDTSDFWVDLTAWLAENNGEISAFEFSLIYEDNSLTTLDIIDFLPLPILPAGYFDPSLNFSDPRNSMYL
jgi:hypothetical protein